MLAQRYVALRLRQPKQNCVSDFKDMRNAFACTTHIHRKLILERVVGVDDMHCFHQRVLNSVVQLSGCGGEVLGVITQNGIVFGCYEGLSCLLVPTRVVMKSGCIHTSPLRINCASQPRGEGREM